MITNPRSSNADRHFFSWLNIAVPVLMLSAGLQFLIIRKMDADIRSNTQESKVLRQAAIVLRDDVDSLQKAISSPAANRPRIDLPK